METSLKIQLVAINIIAAVRKYQAITTPIPYGPYFYIIPFHTFILLQYNTDTTLIFYFSDRFTLLKRNPTTFEFDGCRYSGSTPMQYTSIPHHCKEEFDYDCNPILVERSTGGRCQARPGEGARGVG